MLLCIIFNSDPMPKIGVKYLKRGTRRSVTVGFFYYEIILHHLSENPDGLRQSQLSHLTGIPYSSINRIMKVLTEMNRVATKKLKVYRGPPVKHYIVTPYKVKPRG